MKLYLSVGKPELVKAMLIEHGPGKEWIKTLFFIAAFMTF